MLRGSTRAGSPSSCPILIRQAMYPLSITPSRVCSVGQEASPGRQMRETLCCLTCTAAVLPQLRVIGGTTLEVKITKRMQSALQSSTECTPPAKIGPEKPLPFSPGVVISSSALRSAGFLGPGHSRGPDGLMRFPGRSHTEAGIDDRAGIPLLHF